ncbi:EAL domain-containing protein [Brevibacillus ginsengisoli]|uniref:EAL domain-containing protein n=1 Tax=Brevibacillus ginsengisoli TaxID=363854 RepID=UPI003CF317EA
MYQRTSKGWEKLKLWMQMVFPSSVMKMFPPHFIMRDVVQGQIEKWNHKGKRCILLFFDVKKYGEIKSLYPRHALLQIEESILEAFRTIVTKHISDQELLAVQQFYDDDFIILLKEEDTSYTSQELQQLIDVMKNELEQEIAVRISAFTDNRIEFHSSYVWIDAGQEDVHDAIQKAIQDARAMAKMELDSSIGNFRAEIRKIIEEENIRVVAQPIISLGSGEIEGWEILTRGPENTPYAMPLNLFHFAYQAEMLFSLELLVVKKALVEIQKKKTTCPIFINVTVPTLRNPLFFSQVASLMKCYTHVKPEQIIFEITERHSIEDFEVFNHSMSSFREAGFKFAVDDTGAGYASLNMIAEIMPDFIKIDRSIIQNIDKHDVKNSVLKSLVLLAKNIGCEVVAEGIETEEEANVLLENQVDYAQGFFFSRPQEPFPQLEVNWVNKTKIPAQ